MAAEKTATAAQKPEARITSTQGTPFSLRKPRGTRLVVDALLRYTAKGKRGQAVSKSARTNQHIQYHCDESASANVGAAAAVPYFAHAATIAGEPSRLKASLFRTVFNIVNCYVCTFGLEVERVVF